jgi:hypothetical protein
MEHAFQFLLPLPLPLFAVITRKEESLPEENEVAACDHIHGARVSVSTSASASASAFRSDYKEVRELT